MLRHADKCNTYGVSEVRIFIVLWSKKNVELAPVLRKEQVNMFSILVIDGFRSNLRPASLKITIESSSQAVPIDTSIDRPDMAFDKAVD